MSVFLKHFQNDINDVSASKYIFLIQKFAFNAFNY
jgi:hypothetical protein